MAEKTKQVWVLLFASFCLDVELRVGSTPICAHRRTGCRAPSLADLFDRLLQHSDRVHRLSTDLHREFGQYFLPIKKQIGHRKCHTSNILTPNRKESAQRLAREELTQVILKLLVAWADPLSHLHESMARHHDFNAYSTNKALEMSDMAHKLKTGVQKVAEKMQLLGLISNSLNGASSSKVFDPTSDTSADLFLNDRDLLYCFRRDSNKVQNYLKILKCRIIPGNSC